MLRETYDARSRSGNERAKALKGELATVQRKITQVMDRLVESDDAGLVAAYEQQIRKLNAERIVLEERLAAPGKKLRSFDESYRTALSFVASPKKYWDSGHLAARRLVPNLLFGGTVPYKRNVGYRTGGIAHPFRALRLVEGGQYDLVRPRGLEPPRDYSHKILSLARLPVPPRPRIGMGGNKPDWKTLCNMKFSATSRTAANSPLALQAQVC